MEGNANMSTSVTPRPAGPVHPTRQQLDELDALLQRMLELPVNQLEESAATAEEADLAPAPVPPPRPTAVRNTRPPVSYTAPVPAPRPPAAPAGGESPAMRLGPRVVPAPAYEEEVESGYEEPPPAPRAARQAPPDPGQYEEYYPQRPDEREPAGPEAGAAGMHDAPGPDDWIRLASSWQPSPQTWQPLAESWQQARPTPPVRRAPDPRPVEFAPVHEEYNPPSPPPAPPVQPHVQLPEPEPRREEVILPPAPRVPDAQSEVAPKAAPRPRRPSAPPAPTSDAPTPWVLWPLVAFNLLFDLVLLPWGPLGRGFRTRAGRNLLGILGLLCLAAAAALGAADWFGWTWWPLSGKM